MSRSLPLRKEIKHANKHNFSYSKITVTSVDNAHVRNFPPLTYGIHSVRPEIMIRPTYANETNIRGSHEDHNQKGDNEVMNKTPQT